MTKKRRYRYKKNCVPMTLPLGTYKWLKQAAWDNGMSLNSYVIKLLEEELDRIEVDSRTRD